jgi:hypothetical protein
MARRKTQREWLQDVEARQRNVVFPDTANNEARFWRNIMEGRQRLTTAQKLGIGLFGLLALGLFVLITFSGNNPLSPGFSWTKLAGAGIDWALAFGVLGGFILLFRFSQRSNRN